MGLKARIANFVGGDTRSAPTESPPSEPPAIEPQVFQPVVAPPLAPQSRIRMLITVSYLHHGGPEWLADNEYWVDAPLADSFILKGYADGQLSRDYETPEIESIRLGHQKLTVSAPVPIPVLGSPTPPPTSTAEVTHG